MNKYEEEQGPKLCANGCEFFGTHAIRNLCSMCYNDFLKQHLTKSAASLVDSVEKLTLNNNNSSTAGTTSTANGTTLITANNTDIVNKRNRCESCKQRVGLIGFGRSRCGRLYCRTHRYPEEHSCPFDFKKAGRAQLAQENPLLKGEKLETRF